MSSAYPAHREADVVLRDGSTVRLRPVRPEDEGTLREFFAGLDARSLAFRFFSGAVDVGRAAATLADVDYAERYGLLAVRGEGRVVGLGPGASFSGPSCPVGRGGSPSRDLGCWPLSELLSLTGLCQQQDAGPERDPHPSEQGVPARRFRETANNRNYPGSSRSRELAVLQLCVVEGSGRPPEECSAICNLMFAAKPHQLLPGAKRRGGQFRRRMTGPLPTATYRSTRSPARNASVPGGSIAPASAGCGRGGSLRCGR